MQCVHCHGWAHGAPDEEVTTMLMVGAVVVLSNGTDMLLVGNVLASMHNVGYVMIAYSRASKRTYVRDWVCRLGLLNGMSEVRRCFCKSELFMRRLISKRFY